LMEPRVADFRPPHVQQVLERLSAADAEAQVAYVVDDESASQARWRSKKSRSRSRSRGSRRSCKKQGTEGRVARHRGRTTR